MATTALAAPPAILSTDTTLAVTLLDPGKLFRVSGFVSREPHFGATGGNRFDRAAPKLTATRPRPLLYVKGFAAAARAFNIVPA